MHLDIPCIFEAYNRPRDFEDAVIPTPTQVELRDGGFEQFFLYLFFDSSQRRHARTPASRFFSGQNSCILGPC
ncbi:hypothetical protein IAD21_00273 [Abditibacteriota bacterium]|nr:hypothetical protein IAD21_00273 [Abditibacteriota bacterium]